MRRSGADRASIGTGETIDWQMAHGQGLLRAISSGLHDDGSFAVTWRAS